MRKEPAASIIALLNGLTATASAANTSVTTVQRWRMPQDKGGTDGFIPRKHHDKLINFAKCIGVDLPPSAFIDVSKVPTAPDKDTAA